MTRTREWLIGYAIAACVAIGVGHEIADAMRPEPPAPVCVDAPGNLFNECARLDPSQVQDRRTHTGPPATLREAVIVAIQGDYLWADGPLTGPEFDALAVANRVAEDEGIPCVDMARALQRTGDYRPDMAVCFGDEDSVAVDVILRSVGR